MDRVLCKDCGMDLTETDAPEGERLPCPRCGGMTRVFEASASLVAKASMSGTGSVLVRPATVQVKVSIPQVEVKRIAAHFEHLIRTYPPTTPGDSYVVECINPDTGLVDMVVDDDPAEALRRLSDPFADDL